jgi:hypothetical protein
MGRVEDERGVLNLGRAIVGLGLIVMASALAFYGIATEGTTATQSAAATLRCVWAFLLGTIIMIAGGLAGARR